MAEERLLATCWTTAGDANPLPGDQRSPVPIRERVEVAAAAGFRGIGLLHADLMPALAEYGVHGLRRLLDDYGIVDLELELITDWWTTGAARDASDRVRRELFAAGTRVGLEFLPWSNLKTVHDGLDLVRAAGHPGGGLIIDVWHTERANTPPAELAVVPLEYIVGVELNDADALQVGTLFEDTVHRRRLCGEGSFDLPGVISALRTAGWRGPWGVEILSDDYRKSPLRQAVADAYRTAHLQLQH